MNVAATLLKCKSASHSPSASTDGEDILDSEWEPMTRNLEVMPDFVRGHVESSRLEERGHKNGHSGREVPRIKLIKPFRRMVGEAGIEPTTPGLEGRCSIQLSYSPDVAGIPYCNQPDVLSERVRRP
jgi:hypothetical protein